MNRSCVDLFLVGKARQLGLLKTGWPLGAFSHSGGTAPIITLFYPGNTPENHPPTAACMIHSKQHWGCRIQDPGTRGKHQTETKNPRCSSRGCRVQNSGP